MEVHFVSTLTSDDEDRLAAAVLTAICALLDTLAIAYTLRIETTGAKTFQHTRPMAELVGENAAH